MAKVSRGKFFQSLPKLVAEKVQTKGPLPPPVEIQPVQSMRPPGVAGSDDEFVARCKTKPECEACADACPHDAIAFLEIKYGSANGTPYINPYEKPCHWCEDMVCISACPTKALVKPRRKPVAAIGEAKINVTTCSTMNGIMCDICATVCPSSVKAISIVQRKAKIDRDKCVGCGLCAYYCDNMPNSIHMFLPDGRQSIESETI